MNVLRRFGGSPISWAATAAFVTLMVLWTIVTPAFRNPDEPQHVNRVLRIAEGGGWPKPTEAFVLPEVLRAKTVSGFSAVDGQQGNWVGGTLLPGVRPTIPESELKFYAPYSGRPVPSPEERLPVPQLELTRPVDPHANGDQMVQHPPLYYAISAGVVTVTGALDWPFDRTLTLMRLVSVAMVGLLPLMAFSVTRTLTGNRRLADLAALIPLGIPQLASLGGSVTNDALVIFLGGVATVLMARVLVGDRTWRTLILLAVTLGLALFTKGTLLLLVPVVGLAVVVGSRWARGTPALSWLATVVRLAAVWALAFAIGGWWWLVNLIRYGTIQPSGVPTGPGSSIAIDRPRSSIVEFTGIWLDKLSNTFWGTFGQLELPLPQVVVTVSTVLLLVPVLLAFRRRETRVPLLVLLSFLVLTAAAVFWQTWQSHLDNARYGGIQGRYLFGALVAVFAAVAIGLGTFGREGGRLQRWLPVAVLPVVLLSAAYGLWVAFRGYYIDIGWTVGAAFRRMTDWSPWPDIGVRALIVFLALLCLAVFGLALRAALRRDRDSGPLGDDTLPGAPIRPPVTVGAGA
jgi:hypothetical protein